MNANTVDSASCRIGNAVAPCPICNAHASRLFEVGQHHYLHCPSCTHQFLDYTPPESHLTDHYSDDYFTGSGDGYPDYLAERELLIARGNFYAKKIAKLTGKTTGKLLDIGSAAGFLAKGFQQRGWTVQGIEPSPAMSAHACDKEQIPTTNSSLETFETNEKFDLILLVQVIAHLEDPQATLKKIHTLLKPGGHLLIETWDSHSRTARYVRSGWHEYNPPSVLHAFSRRSLSTLAEQENFKLVASRLTIKSVKASHGKSLLDHKYANSPLFKLVRPLLSLIPNKLSIPYPADDLFWTCLQKPTTSL